MSDNTVLPRVLYIVGPTAVGKTTLSIDLALRVNGEIISADSRCLYKGMDIGTAKPTAAEMALVPHHLINLVEPHETLSLAEYQKMAIATADEILGRGKVPVFVGGTGQYYRALVEGWSVPVIPPSPALRALLQDWGEAIGPYDLYKKLQIIDPEAAEFIDPTNLRRTIRALEVVLTTGMKFSDLRSRENSKYSFYVIGLFRERSELYTRVDKRIEEMFSLGLLEEVRSLMKRGYGESTPPMSAIGYREVTAFLEGKIDLETAKVLMRRNTRKFIRRQANWFKPSDARIHWYGMEFDPLGSIISDMVDRKYYEKK